MSRGLGRVQRALLALLEQCKTEHRPELWLGIAHYDLGLGEHLESRRRAALRLGELGLIELRHATDRDRSGQPNRFLFARLPMTPEEHEEVRLLRDEYLQHRALFDNSSLPPEEREPARKWIQWYGAPQRLRRPPKPTIYLERIDEQTGRIATWE